MKCRDCGKNFEDIPKDGIHVLVLVKKPSGAKKCELRHKWEDEEK